MTSFLRHTYLFFYWSDIWILHCFCLLKTCLRLNKSVDLSHVETDLAEEVVKEIKDEIRDVKTLLVSGCEETNETRLEEVAKEIRNESDRLSDEIKTLLRLVFLIDPSNLPNVFELVRSFIPFHYTSSHFDVQLSRSSTSEILCQTMLTC